MEGRVMFVGGGPGAPDLLTVRAARAIGSADIVIWGRALLSEAAVIEHARPDAELVVWPPATIDDVLRAYDRARDESLTVVRLKSGDPSLFGELDPELSAVIDRGLAYELVPGVSSLGAAAAALGVELTVSGGELLVTAGGALESSGALVGIAAGGGTVALLVPGARAGEVQAKMEAAGLPGTIPCAVAHQVSWPGELVLRCELSELAEQVRELGLDGLTLFIVGPAVGPTETGV